MDGWLEKRTSPFRQFDKYRLLLDTMPGETILSSTIVRLANTSVECDRGTMSRETMGRVGGGE